MYQYLYDTDNIIKEFIKSGTGNLSEMTDLSGTSADFDDDDNDSKKSKDNTLDVMNDDEE